MTEDTTDSVYVDGIVAARDFQPYLRLFANGKKVAQLSMAQARNVAMNILQMGARTEADAMIHKFFAKQEFPSGAGAALMMEFREFRLALDKEEIETSQSEPRGEQAQ